MNKKLYPLDLFRLRQDEAAAFVKRFETDYAALNSDSTSETDFKLILRKMKDQLPNYSKHRSKIAQSTRSFLSKYSKKIVP